MNNDQLDGYNDQFLASEENLVKVITEKQDLLEIKDQLNQRLQERECMNMRAYLFI